MSRAMWSINSKKCGVFTAPHDRKARKVLRSLCELAPVSELYPLCFERNNYGKGSRVMVAYMRCVEKKHTFAVQVGVGLCISSPAYVVWYDYDHYFRLVPSPDYAWNNS